jgi:hypothetical protein
MPYGAVLTSNDPLRVTLRRSGPPPKVLSDPNTWPVGECDPEKDFLRLTGVMMLEDPSLLLVSDMASSLLWRELETELKDIWVSELHRIIDGRLEFDPV